MTGRVSRREFLQQAAAGAAVAWPLAAAAQSREPAGRWKIVAFSKPFIDLDFQRTADLVADVGWDGIECPVRRASTHIAPERVEDDLPKMVDALKARGREVAMITTDIVAADATAERILRTAAKLGIRNYRLGPIRYAAGRPIPEQLTDIRARLRDLAQLNTSIGVRGGIENHSGADMFAAPIWDAVQAIEGLSPALGVAFDIGHATIEGGLSWPIQARLAEPYYTVIYVKDFRWEKSAKGWAPEWCPLGDGAVNRTFFTTLSKSTYAGPICQHHEYDLGQSLADRTAHFKRDLAVLRTWFDRI